MKFKTTERHRIKDAWAQAFAAHELMPSGVQLQGDKFANLAPLIRAEAMAYFAAEPKITWHTHSNHALSSQVACLNFLMPLATRPALLAKLVGKALDIVPPTMLPIEEPRAPEPNFVGFEWPGRTDHLDEWRSASPRGANATNADAIVRFRNAAGAVETLLIEWKYTESYGSRPIDPKGNPTRLKRYSDKAFVPCGPIRADLGLSVENFFYEPFYQLFRQQMLAWRMEKAHEDDTTRVRVLHISPTGNLALHRVTAPALQPFGTDAFDAFRHVLVRPEDFVSRSTETLFAGLLADPDLDPPMQDWAAYIRNRYTFMDAAAA